MTVARFSESTLVCEVAEVSIVPGKSEEFVEGAAAAIDVILGRHTAHGAHLMESIEQPDHFLLLVVWDEVQSHTDFRDSPDFPLYRRHIQEYFSALPQVQHYRWRSGRGLPIA